MGIITSRTRENGQLRIDEERCTGCGLCVGVCKDFSLELRNGKAVLSSKSVFGCIGCGQCAAVCPEDAITVSGREFSMDDLLPLDFLKEKADYGSWMSLITRRRSVRDFRDREVDRDTVDRILKAVQLAPVGIPPSDVGVLVLHGTARVREFSWDIINQMKRSRFFFSGWMLFLIRPFLGKEAVELFSSFGAPLLDKLIRARDRDENLLLYDAPLAMYFYSTSYSDPADPIITATYAMLAAESLGLGTCFIGTPHYFLRYGSKKLKAKYGLEGKHPNGIMLIMGYPRYKFRKGIRRSLAGITYMDH